MPSLKGSGVGVGVGGGGGGVAGVPVGVTVGVATGVALGIGVAVEAGVGVGVADVPEGWRWHWQSKTAARLRMAALTTCHLPDRAARESELLTVTRHGESSGSPRRTGSLSRKVEWLASGILIGTSDHYLVRATPLVKQAQGAETLFWLTFPEACCLTNTQILALPKAGCILSSMSAIESTRSSTG
jgi:hypothetical protein